VFTFRLVRTMPREMRVLSELNTNVLLFLGHTLDDYHPAVFAPEWIENGRLWNGIALFDE